MSTLAPHHRTRMSAKRIHSEGARRLGDRLLDARPDRLDLRDLPYRPPLRSLPARFPDARTIGPLLAGYVNGGMILDQGTEGACTGFGLACVVNYLHYVRDLEAGFKGTPRRVSPRMLYEMAKRYDEWPGEDYEGASCRGALKGWHKHGVCGETQWPYSLGADGVPVFVRPSEGWDQDAATRPLGVYYRIERDSVVDLQSAIVNIGAVYVSADVHDGWQRLARSDRRKVATTHERLPAIPAPAKPGDLAGHAFALVGYNERGFVVQNSWGSGWGLGGFAVLPYDDWIEHASDAWACAIGVPQRLAGTQGRGRRAASSTWRVGSGRSLTSLARSTRNPSNPSDDPWPIDRVFERKEYEPWSTARAYEHTLVSGNDGELVVSDFTRSRADWVDYAKDIVYDRPLASGQGTLKLALYAHGGLNSEDESIRRIRVLGPYFEANGIYPLFLTWKTGIGETLASLTQDWARKLFGIEAERAGGVLERLSEARDRAMEAAGRVLGRGVWTEMRENAAMSANEGRALDLVARDLSALATALQSEGRKLELHTVSHSAGSILLGHLLTRMGQRDLLGTSPRWRTTTFYAPACSVRFAVDHLLPAAKRQQLDLRKLWIYFLSDENERADGLPTPAAPAYGKSLLYLVSRALEDVRKMPLLGMERALDPAHSSDAEQWAVEELASLAQWQAAWLGKGTGLRVEARNVRQTRTNGQVAATHMSFDNNIDVLGPSIERIAGRRLVAPMEWLDY